jgi:hypothetical protein
LFLFDVAYPYVSTMLKNARTPASCC